MKKDDLRINAHFICRTKELGEIFNLPHSEELEKAILTINKACSEEVVRKQDTESIEIRQEKRWCNVCDDKNTKTIVFNANKTHTQSIVLCGKHMNLLKVKIEEL